MAFGQTARVVLRWKASPGVVSYQLQIARETGFSQLMLDEKVKDPVLKWEFLPSTTFFWRVRSFDSEGRASEWSAARQIAAATSPPLPKMPAEGTAVVCSSEPIAFWLETSSVLKEYLLEVSADGRFSPSDTTVFKSKTGEFQTPLPVGAFSWRGRGVDLSDRTTEPSPSRKLMVRLAPPRPKQTTDIAVGAPSVTLSWAGVACARSYVVEATHQTTERMVHEAQETSMAFKPAGAGEYRFRVAARDDKGNQSEFSAESSFRVRLPAPIGQAEAVGRPGVKGSQVELAWAASLQAASYQVEVSKSEHFKEPLSVGVSALTHTVLLGPGRYLWRVTARDSSGQLSFSSEPRSFVVPGANPPPNVALLSPSDGAVLVRPVDGMLSLTWTEVPTAVAHELEVDGVIHTLGAPPIRLELGDGDHVMRVRALGLTGLRSDWSAPVRFYFGRPQVVRASVTMGNQPLRTDGRAKSRVVIRLLDSSAAVVSDATPDLSVDHGALEGLHAEGDAWVVDWRAPAELPEGKTATLSIRQGQFKSEETLKLAADFPPLSLAGVVGGRFNLGAVASPSGALSLGYRAPISEGRPTVHVRAGIYGASTTVETPDGPVAARVIAPSFSLLIGAHLDFGRWTVMGVIGAGAQVTVASVDLTTQTTVLPAFEVVAAVGRRFGPGVVEVELSFLYSRLNTSLAKLQAGGLFVGVGYRFDLSGVFRQ